MMRVREGIELTRTSWGRRWLWNELGRRLYSRRESVCLRRDLTIPVPHIPCEIPLDIRQLQPGDDLSLIADEPGLPPAVAKLREGQRWLLTRDLPAPWVAIDPDGAVCYMVYLLTAQDNERIKKLWGDWLPQLKPGELLYEGTFAAAHLRGQGVMTDAGHRIVEQARESLGVRYGMGFIRTENAAPQRAGQKGGWLPHSRRVDTWRFFRRRIEYLPLKDAQPTEPAQPGC